MDKEELIRALAIHAAIISPIWEGADLSERADAFAVVIRAYVECGTVNLKDHGPTSIGQG